MTVYVDEAEHNFGRMIMCHMIADTLSELHAMAGLIGMKREWFQPMSFPHYDVAKGRRLRAIDFGAVVVTRQQLGHHMRRLRADPKFMESWLLVTKHLRA